jgi:hypothetical protein
MDQSAEDTIFLPDPAVPAPRKNQPVPDTVLLSRYEWLKAFIESNGFIPSYRFIADNGWSDLTRGSVKANLDRMEALGWIKRIPGTKVIRFIRGEDDSDNAASGVGDNTGL